MSEFEVIDGLQDRAALRASEIVKAPDGNVGTIVSLGVNLGTGKSRAFAVVEFREDWRVEFFVSELRRQVPTPTIQRNGEAA